MRQVAARGMDSPGSLVLGSGRRMFPEGVQAALRLAGSVTTTTGVLIATYQPEGVRSGSTATSSTSAT